MNDDAAQARRFHQNGDLASAEPYYMRAMEAHPNDPQIRHDYAVLLMQSRREDHAIPLLRSVLHDSPERSDTATVLALCLRATGNLDQGIVAANRAVSLDARNALAWLIKGTLELKSGMAAESEASLRRCLAIAPRLGEAWHYLGEVLQAQHRWQEASHAYRNAMMDQPAEVMNVAICAELSGQLEVAREGYRHMCRLRPERSDC
ncbi:MAG TPA: tetratricopeptide repeat protein, partial [Pseudoxanthomonas sp.]|nr:tetratricopeptide repeat protein [Pseudoxanthomonas sp.]